MNGTNTVFEVEFRCSNCGNVWTEQYPRGTEVQQYTGKDGLYADMRGSLKSRIQCPLCDSVRTEADDRRPLNDQQ